MSKFAPFERSTIYLPVSHPYTNTLHESNYKTAQFAVVYNNNMYLRVHCTLYSIHYLSTCEWPCCTFCRKPTESEIKRTFEGTLYLLTSDEAQEEKKSTGNKCFFAQLFLATYYYYFFFFLLVLVLVPRALRFIYLLNFFFPFCFRFVFLIFSAVYRRTNEWVRAHMSFFFQSGFLCLGFSIIFFLFCFPSIYNFSIFGARKRKSRPLHINKHIVLN